MRNLTPGIACLAIVLHGFWPALASAQITLQIKDYGAMPMTGLVDGKSSNDSLLARVNGLREEPGGANRFFVIDLNGLLYILDKDTKKLTTYLDFNGREGRSGIFHKLTIESGYGNGLNGFYFDPDYRKNGRFYTIHIEDPSLPGSNVPDNAKFPGLNISGSRRLRLSQLLDRRRTRESWWSGP